MEREALGGKWGDEKTHRTIADRRGLKRERSRGYLVGNQIAKGFPEDGGIESNI
jgi:hypothetical protein